MHMVESTDSGNARSSGKLKQQQQRLCHSSLEQFSIYFDKFGGYMGGYGSSRWPINYEKKEVVENCRALSIFELNRFGFLRTGAQNAARLVWRVNHSDRIAGSVGLILDTVSSSPILRVVYDIGLWGKVLETVDCAIKLESTACFFGGQRWWFYCPSVKDGQACEQRVAKLYLPPGASYFACRTCHSLSYESRQDKHRFYERPQFDMPMNANLV